MLFIPNLDLSDFAYQMGICLRLRRGKPGHHLHLPDDVETLRGEGIPKARFSNPTTQTPGELECIERPAATSGRVSRARTSSYSPDETGDRILHEAGRGRNE